MIATPHTPANNTSKVVEQIQLIARAVVIVIAVAVALVALLSKLHTLSHFGAGF